MGAMILTGETELLGEKPVAVPLCPQSERRGLAWDPVLGAGDPGALRNISKYCYFLHFMCVIFSKGY